MSKRFTDTGKWRKNSFASLSQEMKLIWLYLCDNCDHAGVWDVNFDLLNFQVRSALDAKALDQVFQDKIVWLSPTKLFLPDFVEFQYGELNEENRVHASVLSRLEKLGLKKGLIRSLEGAKDKEKDKAQEKKKDFDLETIFAKYPKRPNTEKAEGLKSLSRQILTLDDFRECLHAAENYAEYVKKNQVEQKFIKQFKTWVGSKEKPNWREWIDPVVTPSPNTNGIVER